jgi:oligoendopeptidase F
MHQPNGLLTLSTSAVLLASSLAVAQQRERAQVPLRYQWNLADLYPTDDAWRAAKDRIAGEIEKLDQFRGTLASSPAALLKALDTVFGVRKEFSRLYAYAQMKSDQDKRDATYQALSQQVQQLRAGFEAKTAWLEPEVLKIERPAIDSFLKQQPKLAQYRMYLDDIQRRKAHTLDEGAEKVIADAGLMSPGPGNIYDIFSDADFPYPTLTLSDGKSVRLDKANYTNYRTLASRDDRRKIFAEFFGSLGKYRGTFGAAYNAQVQRDLFYTKARRYDSAVASALDGSNIPVAVYTRLVEGVNANLSTLHRYLNLRKRILGLDQLHYYDVYVPLVGSVDLEYPIEKAEKTILSAVAPLGPDYQATIEKAFGERWIDLYPTPGKRSGAYSEGATYDVHPFMLINYNGKYDDMSTLAHELGHTMQSYLSNRTQPYATADYPIFVAEVASTFNEALLIDHVLKQIKDDAMRLAILGNYLENARGTVFRQVQFAEFELRAHEIAEKGEPLTGDSLSKLYMEITKKYYAHDKGVCLIDDEMASEWAYIPHFYMDFYVFQYATSFTASQALSEKVLGGDKAETQRYLAFLSAGGSKYPIELLKDAGVDMTTSEPLELTIRKMNRVMDEMEQILDRQGKARVKPAGK